jgi:WD40 repeat protein
LKGHTGAVTSVAFSVEGKRLASASGDWTVMAWDARPWIAELRAEREALSLLHILRAHDQPQSEWLNAISSDQTVSAPVRQRALQFARDWKSLWSAACQHHFGFFGAAFGFPHRSHSTLSKESRSATNPKLH